MLRSQEERVVLGNLDYSEFSDSEKKVSIEHVIRSGQYMIDEGIVRSLRIEKQYFFNSG